MSSPAQLGAEMVRLLKERTDLYEEEALLLNDPDQYTYLENVLGADEFDQVDDDIRRLQEEIETLLLLPNITRDVTLLRRLVTCVAQVVNIQRGFLEELRAVLV